MSIISCEMSAIKCLAFSSNGNFLSAAGKDYTNRELIVVWNIEGILRD